MQRKCKIGLSEFQLVMVEVQHFNGFFAFSVFHIISTNETEEYSIF